MANCSVAVTRGTRPCSVLYKHRAKPASVPQDLLYPAKSSALMVVMYFPLASLVGVS